MYQSGFLGVFGSKSPRRVVFGPKTARVAYFWPKPPKNDSPRSRLTTVAPSAHAFLTGSQWKWLYSQMFAKENMCSASTGKVKILIPGYGSHTLDFLLLFLLFYKAFYVGAWSFWKIFQKEHAPTENFGLGQKFSGQRRRLPSTSTHWLGLFETLKVSKRSTNALT